MGLAYVRLRSHVNQITAINWLCESQVWVSAEVGAYDEYVRRDGSVSLHLVDPSACAMYTPRTVKLPSR
jgi:hypothetical protein